jgi:hypothetical protein
VSDGSLERRDAIGPRHLSGLQQLADLHLLPHRPAARAIMDSTLSRRPLESVLPADRPFYELARFYAAAGSS